MAWNVHTNSPVWVMACHLLLFIYSTTGNASQASVTEYVNKLTRAVCFEIPSYIYCRPATLPHSSGLPVRDGEGKEQRGSGGLIFSSTRVCALKYIFFHSYHWSLRNSLQGTCWSFLLKTKEVIVFSPEHLHPCSYFPHTAFSHSQPCQYLLSLES